MLGNMKSLIVGYGSIGRRHAEVLSALNSEISLVTQQVIHACICFTSIEEAFKTHIFDYIIIANATYLHFETLNKLIFLGFRGLVLIEKPLFSRLETLNAHYIRNIYIAYNLRFHALFRHLKNLLHRDELTCFSVTAGSYLPGWRKNGDYRKCYSAEKEQGGGVLRDLSHELDYVLWLCGQCLEVTAIGGHFSTLEINSDDIQVILMRCEKCPVVNIQLDYLSRVPTRKIVIHTRNQNTIHLDLIAGSLYVNGDLNVQINGAIQKTYITQHELMLKKEFTDFCDYNQGLSVMQLISAIERASEEKKWIAL